MTDTGSFTPEQQDQFTQIQEEAVEEFGNTPFELLPFEQQTIYTTIEESNDAQIEEEATLQAEGDYTAGYEAGEDFGYNEGFTAGVDSVDTEEPYSQGFSAGVDSVDLTDSGTLTPNQISQLEAIQATAEATGAAGVDITSDNQEVYNSAFIDGQISVDLGQPGVAGSGNLNSEQLSSLTAYVAVAQGNLDISNFDNLNEAQQEQYNAIIALGVEDLLNRFDQADPDDPEATLTPQEADLYNEIQTTNDLGLATAYTTLGAQNALSALSLSDIATAAQNNDTTTFSQDVLNEYNDLAAGAGGGPVDFDDVRALFESGGVSGPEAADLLDALLTANPNAAFDTDNNQSIGVPDILAFLSVFGQPVDPIQAPASIGSVFTDPAVDSAANTEETGLDQDE